MESDDCCMFSHFATCAIHEGQEPEQWKSMAIVPPISLSTTFKQFAPAEHAVLIFFLLTFMNVVRLQKC